MVNWQEVGRVISVVQHHGLNGLRTTEIQKLVRQKSNSIFDFKHALEEAVRSGFLRVKNRRFYLCNWQELVSTRKRDRRLPRGRQALSSDSCVVVETAQRRKSSRRRKKGRRRRGTKTSRRRSRPYSRRRHTKTRHRVGSSYLNRRRKRVQSSRRQGRKVSRPKKHQRARGQRQVRTGSNEKITPDGTNRVTPAEHATGKKYPPQ